MDNVHDRLRDLISQPIRSDFARGIREKGLHYSDQFINSVIESTLLAMVSEYPHDAEDFLHHDHDYIEGWMYEVIEYPLVLAKFLFGDPDDDE